MDNAVGEERIAAGRELAGAYLRIGFFEEASAVAQTTTGKKDDELMLIAAVAELLRRQQKSMAQKMLRSHAQCGPTYEMLAAAAAAQDGAKYVAGLTDTQINALNALMRSLRGPIAEIFALNSIDHEETASLKRYYEIASRARSARADACACRY